MRVGVVYAAVQDGYLVFPLNVVQSVLEDSLVFNSIPWCNSFYHDVTINP